MKHLEIPIYDKEGNLASKRELILKNSFLEEEDLISEVVRREASNRRVPAAHTKTRGEVRGGGRKPWRQKGTGRARAGSIRSPLWRGGGATFGPLKERNFFKKINKKMRRKSLVLAIFGKIKEKRFYILETPLFKKSKQFYKHLSKILGKDKKIIYFIDPSEKEVSLYTRNIANLKIVLPDELNLRDILWAEFFLTSPLGFKNIEKRLTSDSDSKKS